MQAARHWQQEHPNHELSDSPWMTLASDRDGWERVIKQWLNSEVAPTAHPTAPPQPPPVPALTDIHADAADADATVV
eukprot:2271468-Amphidinium_carterae.1